MANNARRPTERRELRLHENGTAKPPLAQPVALMLIASLSAALWLGIFRLAAALF